MAELDSVQSQIEDAKEEMLKPYRISTVSGDRYGGGWPRERLHAHGITYHLAAQAPLGREERYSLGSGLMIARVAPVGSSSTP